LLDLALLSRERQWGALEEAVRELRPDAIAFSWRDLQIFSPQDLDGAMRDAFAFFHDPSPARKLFAAFRGLGDILHFRSTVSHSLSLIRRTAVALPAVPIAVGGPGIRIFGERLASKLPARVRVFTETRLDGFFEYLGLPLPSNPIEPELELDFVEAAFPQWPAYREETIGVQTKLGCPHGCLFCLYGFLEGKESRRRAPDRVVEEIARYVERWGSSRIWLADAQLLSVPDDRAHLAEILEGILKARLRVAWSGYLRIHEVDPSLASLMVRSGLTDLEVSLSSGAQQVLDELKLDFTVEQVIGGCETLAAAGYKGKVLVNVSLNAPGETRETLLETMETIRNISRIFWPGRVVPVVFFLAIQPHTGLERRAIAQGHIPARYDPLSVLPWDVIKLIYNPAPLGRLIGRACAEAFAQGEDDVGKRILEKVEAGVRAGDGYR
jgi:radical SAM superfamily enzyme YgiQ (UPF0313 family)